MPMYTLVLQVFPKPAHAEYGVSDGAFASCWINEPTAALAEGSARAAIEADGWDVEQLEQVHEVSREELAGNGQGLARFEHALADGVCIIYHSWPVGAPDA